MKTLRTIIMIPFFPVVVFAGVLLNDLTGILEYYYPLFYKNLDA